MKIKIKAPSSLNVKLYKTNQNKFIIFNFAQITFYFKLPNSTSFILANNYYCFSSAKFSSFAIFIIRSFHLKVINYSKIGQFFFCKKLLLKGLGFKVVSLIPEKHIELKIGFSHYVKIIIPEHIKLYSNKSMIVIEGSDKAIVGNFANKIKKFKLPDSYKGKGIWYKNEIKKLKEIKKT